MLAGIRTCIGVESTARTGFAHNYEQIIATDAITDTAQDAHDTSLRHILPRLARLADTTDILDALA